MSEGLLSAATNAPDATGASQVSTLEPLSNSLPSFSDWLPDALIPAWNVISQYPIVGALVIVVVFYSAAVVIRVVMFRSLARLVGFTQSSLDDFVLTHLKKPVFTTVSFFGLTLATKAAQLPFGTDLIINLLLSIIIASWMRGLLVITSRVLEALSREQKFSLVEARTVPLFDLTSKLLIILVGSYMLLMVWGINPVGWLASAGIVGIAVGFAAKDTLANLFAGFFIVADAPYKIGDYINLDTGERGRVTSIGLRSTRLLTRDDVEITVPNGVIANAKIINESGGPSTKMRVRIDVGVAYGSDVDQVCTVLQKIGETHEGVCEVPDPRVRMRRFGASSLDFELLCWIQNPQDRGLISHELYMRVYKAFAAQGIEIPYAKQDLYIKEWPEADDHDG